jgi:hypothetical protein
MAAGTFLCLREWHDWCKPILNFHNFPCLMLAHFFICMRNYPDWWRQLVQDLLSLAWRAVLNPAGSSHYLNEGLTGWVQAIPPFAWETDQLDASTFLHLYVDCPNWYRHIPSFEWGDDLINSGTISHLHEVLSWLGPAHFPFLWGTVPVMQANSVICVKDCPSMCRHNSPHVWGTALLVQDYFVISMGGFPDWCRHILSFA